MPPPPGGSGNLVGAHANGGSHVLQTGFLTTSAVAQLQSLMEQVARL